MPSSLELRDLQFFLHLGCTPEEQEQVQEVRLSLEWKFLAPPKAMQSDELMETICYGNVCDIIKNYVTRRPFKTIEALAYGVFLEIRPALGGASLLRVSVHKVKTPVSNLLGGASFTLEETL